jgi:hypothetical protein
MLIRALLLLTTAHLLTGCAHKPLSSSALDRVVQPAFISRIEEGAGPRSEVFRQDGTYRPKLKRLDPREADRRLAVKLAGGMSRFELADRLRASTRAQLPQDIPWIHTLDPADVARVLQSFLVDEVPANPPDYGLVGELGADVIVEFVIQEYGMRSRGGKAGAYMIGYGRMFRVDGGELWRRRFKVDTLQAGTPGVDPFRVAKSPELWRTLMRSMLDGVAQQFAADLNPPRREVLPARATGPRKAPARKGEEQAPRKFTRDELAPGELPDPDDDPI